MPVVEFVLSTLRHHDGSCRGSSVSCDTLMFFRYTYIYDDIQNFHRVLFIMNLLYDFVGIYDRSCENENFAARSIVRPNY